MAHDIHIPFRGSPSQRSRRALCSAIEAAASGPPRVVTPLNCLSQKSENVRSKFELASSLLRCCTPATHVHVRFFFSITGRFLAQKQRSPSLAHIGVDDGFLSVTAYSSSFVAPTWPLSAHGASFSSDFSLHRLRSLNSQERRRERLIYLVDSFFMKGARIKGKKF